MTLVDQLILHIEKLRHEEKKSLADIARMLNIDEKQLWRLRRKENSIPLETFEQYARALNLKIEFRVNA